LQRGTVQELHRVVEDAVVRSTVVKDGDRVGVRQAGGRELRAIGDFRTLEPIGLSSFS
jgi:hypothetical protein